MLTDNEVLLNNVNKRGHKAVRMNNSYMIHS